MLGDFEVDKQSSSTVVKGRTSEVQLHCGYPAMTSAGRIKEQLSQGV